MNRILNLIAENPRLTNKQIATMLALDESAVSAEISRLEKEGIIGGYKAIVDWSRVDTENTVTAFIELKVTPKMNTGFDEIGEELLAFPEVDSVYLMSGAYDFAVIVKGSTIQDIAMFVARKLSTIGCVLSTATHFILKKFKESGIVLTNGEVDERRSDNL